MTSGQESESRSGDNDLTRRDFMGRTVKIGAALALAGQVGFSLSACGSEPDAGLASAAKKIHAVGMARSVKALDSANRVQAEVVEQLLDQAVAACFDVKDPADAWGALFNSRDRVGIKVNTLPGPMLSSSLQLTEAVVKRLRQVGVKADSIIVFDRSDRELISAGYKIGTRGGEYLCFGTDHDGVGYDEQITMAGESGSRVSRIASAYCDKLINIPVVKDHDLAGISVALKNYFGIINNPNKCHLNGCSPFVADVYSFPQLGPKTVLVVADGLLIQYEGGPAYKPQFSWPAGLVMAAVDPVAIDTVSLDLIEHRRKEKGLPRLDQAGREVKYLEPAVKHGLGTADLAAIKQSEREI